MKEYTGAGQTIVVIDNGYNDQYRTNDVIYEYDFADGDESSFFHRSNHGSQVSQIVGKTAIDADIINLKVFGDGKFFTDGGAISDSLNWVIDNAETYNITAVNMSLGGGNTTQISDTFLKDEFAKLDAKGIFTVIAAGNSYTHFGEGVTHFAADEKTIAVGATTATDELAWFSQRDKHLMDAAALGQEVAVDNVSGTHFVNGTSFAAPQVAGAAAVVQEAAEDILGHKLTRERFVDLLQKTGDKIIGTPTDEDSQSTEGEAETASLSLEQSQVTQLKIKGAFYTGDKLTVAVDGEEHDIDLVIRSGDNFQQTLDQVEAKLKVIDNVESVSVAKVGYGTPDMYGTVDVTFNDTQSHEVSASVTDNNQTGNPAHLSLETNTLRESVAADTDTETSTPDTDTSTPDMSHNKTETPSSDEQMPTDTEKSNQTFELKLSGAFYTGDKISLTIDGETHEMDLHIGSGDNFQQTIDQITSKLSGFINTSDIEFEKINYGKSDMYGVIRFAFTDNQSHNVDISVADNTQSGNPAPLSASVSDTTPAFETEDETGFTESQEDYGESFETAKSLSDIASDIGLSNTLSGSHDAVDVYHFTILEEDNVVINLETNDNDLDLGLYDQNENAIEYAWNWGGDDVEIHQNLEEGQYFLKVENFDQDQQATYELTIDVDREAPVEETKDTSYEGFVVANTQGMVDYLGQNYDGWVFT